MFQEIKLGQIKDTTKDFPIVDGPFGTQLHAEEYTDEGVPVVRVSNLSFDGRFSSDNLVFITEKKALTLSRSKLTKGDLVVAKTGATIGKAALFPHDYGIVASSCLKASFDPAQADQRFMLYLVMSSEGQRKIIDGASGSTRTTINIKPFENITFKIPPLPYQQKIADILTTLDRAISQTEGLIAKHQRIKTGLMQDLLTRGIDEHGQLRDPSTHRFKSTPLGMIPEEWEVKKVDDAFNLILGKMLNKDTKKGKNPFPYLANRNVQWDRIDLSNLDWMDFSDAECEKLKLLPEDLLICEGGEVGRTAIWSNEMENCYFQKAIHRLRSKDRSVLPKFMLRYMRYAAQRGLFTNFISQTSISHLTQEKLREFPIIFPKVEEQEIIVSVFEKADRLLLQHQSELEKLNSVKQGLMQDLLSGRVSVKGLVEG